MITVAQYIMIGRGEFEAQSLQVRSWRMDKARQRIMAGKAEVIALLLKLYEPCR